MVNGWAYEYAPFAKNKYVRGDGYIVDEIGETYIVQYRKKPIKPLLQETAFQELRLEHSIF